MLMMMIDTSEEIKEKYIYSQKSIEMKYSYVKSTSKIFGVSNKTIRQKW